MEGIKIFKLDHDSLDKILNQVEGHFLDFKRKAVQPSKLSQTISAFANAEGGELYVCLSPLKDWTNCINQFSHSKFRNYVKDKTTIYPGGEA